MLVDNEIHEVQKQIIANLKEHINFKNLEPGDKALQNVCCLKNLMLRVLIYVKRYKH